jgi:hypothetical protein
MFPHTSGKHFWFGPPTAPRTGRRRIVMQRISTVIDVDPRQVFYAIRRSCVQI